MSPAMYLYIPSLRFRTTADGGYEQRSVALSGRGEPEDVYGREGVVERYRGCGVLFCVGRLVENPTYGTLSTR
jgi:hypothetical protein